MKLAEDLCTNDFPVISSIAKSMVQTGAKGSKVNQCGHQVCCKAKLGFAYLGVSIVMGDPKMDGF